MLLEVSLGRGASPLGLDERAGLVAAVFSLGANAVKVRMAGREVGLGLLEAGVEGAGG